jgi:hypothetical protein
VGDDDVGKKRDGLPFLRQLLFFSSEGPSHVIVPRAPKNSKSVDCDVLVLQEDERRKKEEGGWRGRGWL